MTATAEPESALSEGNFRAVMRFIQPKPEELRWLSILWQTDLWEARRMALVERKPIFLWTMNGDPLGCT